MRNDNQKIIYTIATTCKNNNGRFQKTIGDENYCPFLEWEKDARIFCDKQKGKVKVPRDGNPGKDAKDKFMRYFFGCEFKKEDKSEDDEITSIF